jgi:staphylococcal nuclease domain-containing protein 1
VLKDRAERYWAAEGKETLRRRLIGQKVRVVYDYTRKAKNEEGDKKGLPEKAYYSVYHGDQNIAVILVESGFAQVLRAGEERSVDYEILLMAEKKASDNKKGVWTPVDKVPARRFNDLCVDNDPEKRMAQIARTKPFLTNFERVGPMKAIIDYVFSGARFKVTVPKQTCVFMFALSGLRVPKREDGEELSNAALTYSRERLHQIEVTIEVDGLDKGGNFVGSLHVGKKNFAVSLLENGFAYIHYGSAEKLKEFKEFQTAEEGAKSKRLGYWKNYDEEAEKAKLAASAEAGDHGALQGKKIEVIVTEIVDGARLHVQIVGPEHAGLDELVNQLTELSVSEGNMPPITPKVGDLVRGFFPGDNRWYRAKVTEIEGGKYTLFYVDYGNTEVVAADQVRVLPANSDLKALPAQAQLAALAFIKPLKEDSENSKEAKEALADLAGGKKLQATVEYKDANAIYLTLVDPHDNFNISLDLVQQGYARMERGRRRHQANPTYVALREAEDKAKQRRIGIWYYGDIPDSDEDEREAPKKGAPTGKAGKDVKGAPAAAVSGKKK